MTRFLPTRIGGRHRPVWDAYGRWESTADSDHAGAHAAYLAAVDQEQAAANAYADLVGRVTVLLAVR